MNLKARELFFLPCRSNLREWPTTIVSTESKLSSFSCQRKLIQQNDNWNHDININIYIYSGKRTWISARERVWEAFSRCWTASWHGVKSSSRITLKSELIATTLTEWASLSSWERTISQQREIASIDILEISWSAFVSSNPSDNPILVLAKKKRRLSGN